MPLRVTLGGSLNAGPVVEGPSYKGAVVTLGGSLNKGAVEGPSYKGAVLLGVVL